VLTVSRELGVFAILVDAKDEQAAAFCARYGFASFPLRASRMFMLTRTARAAGGTRGP